MTTREQQIAAAEAIAAANPEWGVFVGKIEDGIALRPRDGRINPRAWFYGGLWHAWDEDGISLKTRSNATRTFRSPSEAIRAIGFTLREP